MEVDANIRYSDKDLAEFKVLIQEKIESCTRFRINKECVHE